MIFDKPIIVEKQDEKSEQWHEYIKLHAHVNKNTQKEYDNAGSSQNKRVMKFEVRYCKPLQNIPDNTQIYRIVYRGVFYNITQTDNYNESNQTLKMIGESY